MKYLKITYAGQFLGIDILSVGDVREAFNGDCLLVDIQRSLYLSPRTYGEWEPITQVRMTAPLSMVAH